MRQIWHGLVGNAPKKPDGREVEVFAGEFLHEEVKVFRQPDHGCAQARGSGAVGARCLPGTGHQRGHVLHIWTPGLNVRLSFSDTALFAS